MKEYSIADAPTMGSVHCALCDGTLVATGAERTIVNAEYAIRVKFGKFVCLVCADRMGRIVSRVSNGDEIVKMSQSIVDEVWKHNK